MQRCSQTVAFCLIFGKALTSFQCKTNEVQFLPMSTFCHHIWTRATREIKKETESEKWQIVEWQTVSAVWNRQIVDGNMKDSSAVWNGIWQRDSLCSLKWQMAERETVYAAWNGTQQKEIQFMQSELADGRMIDSFCGLKLQMAKWDTVYAVWNGRWKNEKQFITPDIADGRMRDSLCSLKWQIETQSLQSALADSIKKDSLCSLKWQMTERETVYAAWNVRRKNERHFKQMVEWEESLWSLKCLNINESIIERDSCRQRMK